MPMSVTAPIAMPSWPARLQRPIGSGSPVARMPATTASVSHGAHGIDGASCVCTHAKVVPRAAQIVTISSWIRPQARSRSASASALRSRLKSARPAMTLTAPGCTSTRPTVAMTPAERPIRSIAVMAAAAACSASLRRS